MKGNLMKGKMKGHFRKGKKGIVHELEFIQIINELLLIKFDISFYVRYRSEEISPCNDTWLIFLHNTP